MKSLTPGYGETPLEPDEADALTSAARELLGEEPTLADVYDVEEAISDEVGFALAIEVLDGRLELSELLTDAFIRELHRRLYGDIWMWAGMYRRTEKSVGIDPVHIAVELRQSLENIAYRWKHTADWTPRELGIVVHAETVRIHPFVERQRAHDAAARKSGVLRCATIDREGAHVRLGRGQEALHRSASGVRPDTRPFPPGRLRPRCGCELRLAFSYGARCPPSVPEHPEDACAGRSWRALSVWSVTRPGREIPGEAVNPRDSAAER